MSTENSYKGYLENLKERCKVGGYIEEKQAVKKGN
jgi:hypothetical protein